MNPIISIDKLGKLYAIGSRPGYKTLRESIMSVFTASRRSSSGSDLHRKIWALKDVSLEVKAGEVLGIIGRNGAGKSTLLKILSRVTDPSEGEARIHGRIGSLLEVGTGFHPELTGRENIYLNGAILGMRKTEIRNRFDEIVEFAEVEKFLDTPVKRYSSGMYVRLAFAVAAHLETEVLIVDEVLAVGDAQFQKKCLGKMEEAGKDGRTILFVSHNMNAISRLCTRTLLFESGKMAKDGATAEVVSGYLRSGANSGTKFIQPADENIPLCLLEAQVCSGAKEESNSIPRHEPVTIRIKYQINRNVSSVHVYSAIFDSVGTYVLGTGDADTDLNRGTKRRKPGTYVCEYQIPARTLNTGTYTVSISLGIPYRESYQEPDNVLTFNIVDSDKTERFISRQRAGVMWLDIPWKYLGDDPF